MKVLSTQLNCSTEQEYYRMAGILLVSQKLLNDYLSMEDGMDPEVFVEKGLTEFGLTGDTKELVFQTFLTEVGRNE